MKKLSTFTWILIFFFIIGLFSAFRNNFMNMIIPIIIFGLIFYFIKHPEKLNFLKKNNKNEQKQRKSSFTVIDGKFKDNNNK